MNCSDVSQSIEFVRRALKNIIQSDRTEIGLSTVSWQNYRQGFTRNQYYPMEYQWLLDNQQYSFCLSNGFFLQFYYEFDHTGLVLGRAALYPRPLSSIATVEEIFEAAEKNYYSENDLTDYLLNVVEEIEQTGVIPPNTSHIRFDFDRNAKGHEPSHIQFGGIDDFRIPSEIFPLPFSFVQLVSKLLLDDSDFAVPPSAIGHSTNNLLKNLVCEKALRIGHR